MFRNRPRLAGFLIGLTVTVICCISMIAFNLGMRLELQSLDSRFRWLSTLLPDPRIVHVDIDDSSLDRVGRWPWPRDKTAELIRTLHELGASVIAVDLLLDDRETPIQENPAERDADIEPDVPIMGDLSDLQSHLTDDELADAIRTSGNVFLSIHMPCTPPDQPDPPELRLEALFEKDPSVNATTARQALELPNNAVEITRLAKLIDGLRVRRLLMEDFTFNDSQIATTLGLAATRVAEVVAGAKSAVAGRRVAVLLQANPNLSSADVRKAILKNHADANDRDAADVRQAYRAVRSLAAVLSRCPAAPAHARQVLQRAYDAQAPLFYFVQGANGVGAVNFDKDVDGAVRAIPAMLEYEGKLVPHLSLAVACNVLGVRVDQIQVNADRTVSFPDPTGGPAYVLPLDGRGRLMIHWTQNGDKWRITGADFPHMSATWVWAIADARAAIRQNLTAIDILMDDVVKGEKGKVDRKYRLDVARKSALARGIHVAELRRQPMVRTGGGKPQSLEEARAELASVGKSVAAAQAEAREAVQSLAKQARDELTPAELKEDARAQEVLRAEEIVTSQIEGFESANQRLATQIEKQTNELRPKIQNKVVFLGYSATALGDQVATAIDPFTNGVMCHAHMLNTILSRRFEQRVPKPIEMFMVMALGALVSYFTAVKSPKWALAITLGVMLAYTVVCALVQFRQFDQWMVLVAALITFFLVWAFVTLFRQLTAERERRIFNEQLSQYTSPAIAATIAADPGAAAAFKSVQTRDITILFTDLAGFTSISESQDAETVQYVLNTYLERMSKVIWARRGLINKFMGDGVMAFFNASVDPMEDHARIALDVTLDAFDEMERIKVEEQKGPYAALFAQLGMRAGLSTGLCKNGDFGSELKADYTVIGDVVNLAARLEPANKVFGTKLIIPQATRDRVGDNFEYRYLAELQVKGKRLTVPVYAVVGRKGSVDAAEREYIERFEAGVKLYQARKWDECIRHFTRILARRPDDLGASRYIEACEELRSFPPEADWAGALELKEK